jgi:raffinose/stachyose/melibiose transport system substrate-binding protein
VPRTARLTATALTLTLTATALTGCSLLGDDETPDPRVSVLANVTDKPAMDSVLAAFRHAHPDIRVAVDYADTDTLQKDLPRRLRAGRGPDVFTVWPGSGNPASVTALEQDDLLEDLSLRRFNRSMPTAVKPVTDVLDGTYVVPVNYSAIGAIYSTRALDAIGGDAPTTWTGLLALCDTARDHGKVLFALGNATPWVTQLVSYALVATTVYADDPRFDTRMQEGEASFAGSGWEPALRKYLEMRDRGCFGDDPLDTTYEDALDQVADGRAVGVVQIASTLSALRAAAPGLDLRMAALPATDDPGETMMPAAVSAAYGLSARTPHREAALAFVDFLGSERGQNLYNRSGATLPAIPNDSFDADPAVAEVAAHQKAGRTVAFMDQLWPNSAVQQTHFRQIRALFAGTSDVERALSALDTAYRDR